MPHDEERLTLQEGVQLALIGRYYERIGDHAVNIGERVRYMVTGWLPEQKAADRAARRNEPAPSPMTGRVSPRLRRRPTRRPAPNAPESDG
ncbi:MAG: PhoU domain-containing protein [Microthrixaceae bacterium]